jgi:hypothetical protein
LAYFALFGFPFPLLVAPIPPILRIADDSVKTLHLSSICARISRVSGTDTESVEKWATPTFLLVKNLMEQE